MKTTLTTTQAATIAEVSISTLCWWCQSGDLPASKHGRAWVIDRAELDVFLAQPRRGPGQYERKRQTVD